MRPPVSASESHNYHDMFVTVESSQWSRQVHSSNLQRLWYLMHLHNQRLNVIQSWGKFSTSSLTTVPEMLVSEVTPGLLVGAEPNAHQFLCHGLINGVIKWIKGSRWYIFNSRNWAWHVENKGGLDPTSVSKWIKGWQREDLWEGQARLPRATGLQKLEDEKLRNQNPLGPEIQEAKGWPDWILQFQVVQR